jgi:hypothetical protein
MTKPIARDPMYRKRVFDADIIELCVRWYITYRLSYRDLVEMMAERGIKVAHSTILRWGFWCNWGHCEHAKAIHPFYRLSMQAPLPTHLSVTIRDVADPAQKRIAAYGYDGQAQCLRS